jgi:hypothetical protein
MATALVAACGAAAGDVALDALRKCVAAAPLHRRFSMPSALASDA